MLLTDEEQKIVENKTIAKLRDYCLTHKTGKPNGEEIGRHIRQELCVAQHSKDVEWLDGPCDNPKHAIKVWKMDNAIAAMLDCYNRFIHRKDCPACWKEWSEK